MDWYFYSFDMCWLLMVRMLSCDVIILWRLLTNGAPETTSESFPQKRHSYWSCARRRVSFTISLKPDTGFSLHGTVGLFVTLVFPITESELEQIEVIRVCWMSEPNALVNKVSYCAWVMRSLVQFSTASISNNVSHSSGFQYSMLWVFPGMV